MWVQDRITQKLSVLHIFPMDRKECCPKPSSFLCIDSAGEALSFAWFLVLWRVSGVTNSLKRTQGAKKEREKRKILGRQDERLGQVPGCHLAQSV